MGEQLRDALRERRPDAEQIEVADCWLDLAGPTSVVRVRYDNGDYHCQVFAGREVFDSFGQVIEAAVEDLPRQLAEIRDYQVRTGLKDCLLDVPGPDKERGGTDA